MLLIDVGGEVERGRGRRCTKRSLWVAGLGWLLMGDEESGTIKIRK